MHDHPGFFAVSDGMGALENGAVAAQYVCESMPEMARICLLEYETSKDAGILADALRSSSQLMSDHLPHPGNRAKPVS